MQRMVVVGASLAGLRAVEAARRLGFEGELVLVGDEPHAPYDRPPLSKEILKGEWDEDRLPLRSQGLDELDVQFRRGESATGLDLKARQLLVGAERLDFDRLVIATGARARVLPGQPALSGVHTLRTVEDARSIREALKSKPRVVVIGAGFIGAEVASSARSLGLEVTIVEQLPVPLSPKLGERMGKVCAQLHTDHGTELKLGVSVRSLEGEDGAVSAVVLSDGTRLAAELVVVGIGVKTNTEWLEGSGVQLDDGVLCDASCRVLDGAGKPIEGVVAAGDVANWYNPLFEERMRVEHWTHAVEQAEHAVAALLSAGEPEPFATAPLFWSDQYGVKIQFAGRSQPGDEVHVCHGDVEAGRFVALYGRAGRLVGVLGFKRPPQVIKYRRLIQQRASYDDLVRQLSS